MKHYPRLEKISAFSRVEYDGAVALSERADKRFFLLPDPRVHGDDFRLGVLHRQKVAFGLRRFTLGFGLRQLYPARRGNHLCEEVLIAVATEDQSRLAAVWNLKRMRESAGGPLRLPVADHHRVESAGRLEGV